MGGGGDIGLGCLSEEPVGGEKALLTLSLVCWCLWETTAPLWLRLNLRKLLSPRMPVERVAERGFFSWLLFARRLFTILERASGEESEDCGDSPGPLKLLLLECDSCCSSGEFCEGSGVLRGVGEVLWSSKVSPARRSIMEKRFSMLFSAGMSVDRDREEETRR